MMPSLEINTNPNGGSSNQTPTPPPIGTLIDDGTDAGALQLTTVLGYGGYGVVYRAVAPSGGIYAVKCLLRTANSSNPKQAARQRRLHMREIALHRLAGAGAHPGIVHLLRVIEPQVPSVDDGTPTMPYTFLVMDFAPCGDLFTLILHRQVYLGRTSLVAKVFAQLCSAVQHCHSLGIYHRDLKPENVLCWDGGATVRLADFGLATTEHRSKEWRTGSVYHMSPECQNGNAQSPPYSPLANDIWSLAILLLNLLTARNPWARASPSDPTFSAYLSSPNGFLPQVLPISGVLNKVLVKALDINWEVREMFGVDGLAQGVARVARQSDEEHLSRSLSFGKAKSGMYAPDVVFEGGMARCPWEVGMHIPSGSGSSDGQENRNIRIPEELMLPPKSPLTPIAHDSAQKRVRGSSASYYESNAGLSPSQSAMLEAQEIPPQTPLKEDATVDDDFVQDEISEQRVQPVSGWSIASASIRDNGELSRRSSYSYTESARHVDEELESKSAMSDIRFAHHPSSSSSSAASSISDSRTPAFQDAFMPEPRVSDADLVEDGIFAIAASPETPIDESEYAFKPPTPYTDIYHRRRLRNRARNHSRGRQPYPQRNSRESLSRRSRHRRNKPDLKVDVDLPPSIPQKFHSNGSTTVGDHTRSRSRSSEQYVRDFRRRMREESVSSSPFAYSVSRSVYSPDRNMDLDRDRYTTSLADIHMFSPSVVIANRHSSGEGGESESFHTSFDGSTLSHSVVSVASPSGATEDSRERPIILEPSPISPGTESNARQIFDIERSTYTTNVTSPTEPRYHLSDDGLSLNGSDITGYMFDYNYRRSPSPSASSSRFAQNLTNRGYSGSREYGAREKVVSRESREREVDVDWVGELRKAAGVQSTASETLDGGQGDVDDFDDIPSFPGSYPTSRAASVRPGSTRSRGSRVVSYGDVSGLGLDLYSKSRPVSSARHQEAQTVRNSTASRVGSGRYSVPPPSIRSRTNSADEALRALHAIAVEANAWHTQRSADWQRPASSVSTSSTRPTQTFMAITTDAEPPSLNAYDNGFNATTEDFREYAPYLQYAETGAVSDENLRLQSSAASKNSFRTSDANATGATASSTAVQCGETSIPEATKQQESAANRRRSRSRTRSLLKFVSRRPFSSSGSGFIPFRSSQTPPQAAVAAEPGFTFGKGTPASFSAAFTVTSGTRVSTTLNIDTNGTVKSTSPLVTCLPSLPPDSTASFPKRRRIDDPELTSTSTSTKSAPPKPRTWSFTRSRSQMRRRSRSLSPPPSHGPTRDVLLRLRSARNWFWYALSGMASRSTSSVAKKTSGAKWTPSKPQTNLSTKPQPAFITKTTLINVAA